MSALDQIASWPGKRGAAGWIRRDGRSEVTGDEQEVFALASVTKMLAATAVLVAVEEEAIELDEPAGPPGSTVRLLLCHASGLAFDGPRPIAEPGRRRIYGNGAFDVLGELVTERSGVAFADYLEEAVFVPLGMLETVVHESPATSGRSTLADLLRFANELLSPGSVLAPETLHEATTPQLPDLAGVLPGFGKQAPNPWGLGFELRDGKSPHWMPPDASPRTFGHFGQTGTFLWVDPDVGVACVALTDEPFGDWARRAWPSFGSAVLADAAR